MTSLTDLPPELLEEILLYVKWTSTLSPCLCCCKIWRDLAVPLLYHDVVLTNTNLDDFGPSFNPSYGPLIRSLSIAIRPPFDTALYSSKDIGRVRLHGSQGAHRIWARLERVITALDSMVNLLVFSFVVVPEPKQNKNHGFWIPRDTIAAMVKSLPESCVNMELDSKGYDRLQMDPEKVHLCDEIRARLPRLRHLRLLLNSMCPTFLSESYVCKASRGDEPIFTMQPTYAPYLESLTISLISPYTLGGRTRLCDTTKPSTATARFLDSVHFAWPFLCDPLRMARQKMPAIELMQVVIKSQSHTADMTLYAPINVLNFLREETWSLPTCTISYTQGSKNALIRTPSGQEALSDSWSIRALAEGEVWIALSNGARIPASVFGATKNSRYAPKKDLVLFDRKRWQHMHPTEKTCLWLNEDTSGARLLDAECTAGLVDVSFVGERTPAGWRRVSCGAYATKLVKV